MLFPTWWTHYLNSVSAANPVQIPFSLLFLELDGYWMNAAQLQSTPQTSWPAAA
jgi:hypothetical protein